MISQQTVISGFCVLDTNMTSFIKVIFLHQYLSPLLNGLSFGKKLKGLGVPLV